MKISIVTSSLNQGAYIPEAMESVRTQNHLDVEHLVLDGRSTDSTVPWLTRTMREPGWEHVRWISEPDSGQSDAMNKGFRIATGDIIGWLNSDDRYCPQAFARVAQFFAEHPEVDIVYGDYTYMDADGHILTPRHEIRFNFFILMHHRVLYIPTTSTFFRRRIFYEGNFLDESMHYAMDYEFFVRLAQRGYRFHHMPQILADFRLHPESKTCTLSIEQRNEMHTAMRRLSLLSRIPFRPLREPCFFLLQKLAGLMRYCEKLLRGCYWTQRNPKSI